MPGVGDFRVPGAGRRGPRRLDGARPALRRRTASPPASRTCPALPSTYAESDDEAETLEVDLVDAPTGLRVTVRTTLFADRPVVARSLTLVNGGDGAADRAAARCRPSLDLPDADWQLVTLSGAWARERHVHDRPLVPGRQSVGSLRGATGHEHSPFLALRRAATTEDAGEAFGVSLVYSGNFLAEAEVEPFGTTRLRIGIHPEAFAWRLEPGDDVHHARGRDRLVGRRPGRAQRGVPRPVPRAARPRPVARPPAARCVLNNWEATYFDFDHDRIVGIAERAKDLGVELFVLDDGWFGRRDNDDSSLGDWVVDRRKLPGGLEALVRDVRALGLRFGLWIEPEMVNPTATCSAPTPTGRSACPAAADGEPPAARARPVATRRSSTTSPTR